MQYLTGTRALPLILSANGSVILKWWVDASFAVHPKMRGHSGVVISMERGLPIAGPTKQKLNSRSSTETEIVGVEDFMPAICWTKYFLKAQGYNVRYNRLHQDNKSSIILEKNGKDSSIKCTKHINIRYFFISNRVAKGEVSIVWFPNEDMVSYYRSKPVQGAMFLRFRDQTMGVVPSEYPGPGKAKVSKTNSEWRLRQYNKL